MDPVGLPAKGGIEKRDTGRIQIYVLQNSKNLLWYQRLLPSPASFSSSLKYTWLLHRKGFSPIWVFNQVFPLPEEAKRKLTLSFYYTQISPQDYHNSWSTWKLILLYGMNTILFFKKYKGMMSQTRKSKYFNASNVINLLQSSQSSPLFLFLLLCRNILVFFLFLLCVTTENCKTGLILVVHTFSYFPQNPGPQQKEKQNT